MQCAGCDCNYAMCTAERSGDHDTWKYFSRVLKNALLRKDPYTGRVFTGEIPHSSRTHTAHTRRARRFLGIPKVQLEHNPEFGTMFLATHTSTSTDRAVAERFMGDDGGMIIEIDAQNTAGALDVSWM